MAVQFNLNRSLEHPDVDAESCMPVEKSSLLSVELNSDCTLQHSINEIEMNFQYLESIDCEKCKGRPNDVILKIWSRE